MQKTHGYWGFILFSSTSSPTAGDCYILVGIAGDGILWQVAVNWRWVLLVNVLLGWTVLGWLAALVWVLLDRVRDPGRKSWPR